MNNYSYLTSLMGHYLIVSLMHAFCCISEPSFNRRNASLML